MIEVPDRILLRIGMIKKAERDAILNLMQMVHDDVIKQHEQYPHPGNLVVIQKMKEIIAYYFYWVFAGDEDVQS